MDTATLVLTPLITLTLLVVLVLVARMVRGWRPGDGAAVQGATRERIALEDEKLRLLMAVQDIEHEHAMGKLSEADYVAMRRRFELEAVAVIEELESR